MTSAYRCLLKFFTVALLASCVCFGQVTTGTPPFASLGGGPFDTINLSSLNAHFDIPVVSKAGRGIPFTYTLSYDSSIWYPTAGTWQPVATWGWRGATEIATGYMTAKSTAVVCDPVNHFFSVTFSNFVYHDTSGTTHAFAGTAKDSEDCPPPYTTVDLTTTAIDGSGYKLYFPAVGEGIGTTLTTPSGKVTLPPYNVPTGIGTVTDANGNQITATAAGVFTDTLNKTAMNVTGSGTMASPINFAYTAPSGSPVSAVMKFMPFNVKTNFTCGITQYSASNVPLATSITLPDGSQYSFTYEPTPGPTGFTTGRLASITLPTGGTITYAYTGANNGINCVDGSALGLTRTLNPGGAWTYVRNQVSGAHWTTTITDPALPTNNQTVIDFQGIYESQRIAHQGSSSVLATTITCYNTPTGTTPTPSACPTASVSLPILRKTVFPYVGSSTSAQTSETDTVYDNFGLVNEVDEYDYGSSPAGSLLRKTITAYTGGLTNGIVDRPSSVLIKDGSGNTKARTTYAYDETSVTNSGVTQQHVSISGSRGNLTTAISQANATINLYRKFTYYDTGSLSTSTGLSTSSTTNGPLTTYNYTAGAASCNNAFVTSITEPLSLSRAMTWDCNGGALTQLTDENGQPTTFGYDNMWRQSLVTSPDGGQTTTTFNLASTPPNITTSSKIDAVRNLTGETVLDGLGRAIHQQLTSDPTGTDVVDTAYDTVGHVLSVSNPYRTMGDPTYGTTGFSYDALDRVTQMTHPDANTVINTYSGRATKTQDEGNGTSRVTKVSQIDGLGRLASVCEVTSTTQIGITPTPTACGQDITATGFLTSYGYDAMGNVTSVTQGGLNARTYSYDILSRLTQEVNPESGTKTYTYDTGTAGDLYQRVAPKPNQTGTATVTTTYTFDALHRLTGASYNDGVGSDLAKYKGTSLANTKRQQSRGIDL
jgi:YD repeat-containing protein